MFARSLPSSSTNSRNGSRRWRSCEDAILVAQQSGLRRMQLVDNITIYVFRVIPDDDPMVLDLLGDQRHEFFGDFSHTVCRL